MTTIGRSFFSVQFLEAWGGGKGGAAWRCGGAGEGWREQGAGAYGIIVVYIRVYQVFTEYMSCGFCADCEKNKIKNKNKVAGTVRV